MKKLFFSILVWSLSTCALFAQNTAYYQRMKHIFENIDPAKITTGPPPAQVCFTCVYSSNKSEGLGNKKAQISDLSD